MNKSLQTGNTKKTNLEKLIEELHKIFEEEKVEVEKVKEILSAYKSDKNDWEKYAKFDPLRYTRNLVDEGNGKFNLIALCWGEDQESSIHDHSDSHCFVKMLDGELTETMFNWPDSEKSEKNEKEMIKKEQKIYSKNQVAYINDSMGLHRMGNTSHSNKTVSLHLYSPPFLICKSFEQESGKSVNVKMTFYSKFGKKTKIEN